MSIFIFIKQPSLADRNQLIDKSRVRPYLTRFRRLLFNRQYKYRLVNCGSPIYKPPLQYSPGGVYTQGVYFTFEENVDNEADDPCFTLNVPEIEQDQRPSNH